MKKQQFAIDLMKQQFPWQPLDLMKQHFAFGVSILMEQHFIHQLADPKKQQSVVT